MDPTVVLKYVREQRRQINDKFNTHQKLSPNSLSVSPNSASPNPVFQAPQAPIVRSRYPNSYPIDQNYSQKQMNMMDMNNNNNNYAHKMMFNAMQKQELDMCIMNRSIQNSSQKNDNYYHQMQMANEALSRSASVKSDSGIGSNSPSSDNSDYNSNPNYMYQKNYKPIQPHLPQMPHQQIMSPSSPFQMVKKRKNSYDDTCLYPNKIDNMQERAFQNYAKNIPENSNMNIFNPNNNNNINNNNINTTNNNNNNNNNSNNNSNKVPLHNSYYANQQICDKECCAHLKQINVQKPITPKHIQNNVKSQYCDCKECNDLLNKKNYPVQMHPHMQPHMPSHMTTQINLPPGYCDCPSCNIALANNSKAEAKNNHHNLVTPKPVMINPLPPVPTNRFVISQNSSFSPIAPTLQKYPQNIDPNYKFKKDNFNPYETSQEHGLNKCSCPECLKYKPGEISPKALSQKSSNQNSGLVKIAKQSQLPQQPLQPQQISQTPQQPQNPYSQKPKIAQQTGLTLPVVLAADLANYENYQSIVKQKNTYYSEINKRKIDEEAQSKQPVTTPQTTYYKKNRVLNHDSNNNTNNTNIPNKSEKKNNEGLRCLNNDDIELGEVVNVNKVENEQIPKSASQETLIESFNRDSESPVAISKKMMPIISKRTNDWLEKSVEFTFKLSQISGLSLDKLFNILLKSWSKLLFIYMIEHNLEFYVTKDYSIETKIVSYPKERDASNLLEIINRGHQDLGLESQGYDLLREIVLLNEGVNDVQFSARLNVANSRLKESLSGQDSRYEKLVAFLPNIHNIKSSLIENLFYKNSPVQDILNKKLSDLLNKRVENVDTE